MNEQYLQHQRFPESRLWAKYRHAHRPIRFTMELTARCTLDCRHCYLNRPVGDRAARTAELTTEEILAIAAQAVEMGALWVTLTGGEPLLREDFPELYLALKRLGLLVTLLTNATMIDETHAQLWAEFPPRALEVTVYGVTRETYETVTQRSDSFAHFQRGISLLAAHHIPVTLKAVAMRSNLHEFPAIADFCRARCGEAFRYDAQLQLRSDGDQIRNTLIRAERLTPAEITALDQHSTKRLQALQQLHEDRHKDDSSHGLFHCGAGRGSFAVSYDGQFRLCLSLTAPGTTYDLRTGTLREAVEHFIPSVRARLAGDPVYCSSCAPCTLRNLCMNCPAFAYLESGAMDCHSPYFCEVAKARGCAASSDDCSK